MATLSQVYSNLAIGGVVTTTSFIAFGIAVGLEANKNLAPRAWARPIKVLKNCLSPPYSLSWISWAMSLRYIDLLSGIPGTGTREGGRSGPTLRTNLDGIVLLRYHTLQFKVSLLATVLCLLFLLPMYYTSPCSPQVSGLYVCNELRGLSDFEQLTIANVVPHFRVKAVSENGTTTLLDEYLITNNITNGTDVEFNEFSETGTDQVKLEDINLINSLRWRWISGISERYLACAVSIVLITIYTCYLLWHEWIECLALRRVYYLESDYYEERLEELDEILTNEDPEDPFQKIRPPFLPHPEMRETVPNISLHSALFKLPTNLCTKSETNEDDKCLMERQLEAAAVFFDQCIPAQRGYTSSIVAVSLVPDAKKLTKVWGKWYILGNILRRIRYIKRHLEIRRDMRRTGKWGLHEFFVTAPVCAAGRAFKATNDSIEAVTEKIHNKIGRGKKDTKNEEESTELDGTTSTTVLMSGSIVIDSVSNQDESIADVEDPSKEIEKEIENNISSGFDTATRKAFFASTSGRRASFEYDEFDPVAFARWLGYTEETQLNQVIDTLEIEQLSVFARETSQSASNPCVYGMAPEALRFASIEKLETLLEDAWESAHEANDALLAARAEMFRKVKKIDLAASIKTNDDENVPQVEESEEPETSTQLGTIPESDNVEYKEDFSPTSNFERQKSEQPNGLRQRGRKRNSREKYALAQELVRESNRHILDSGEETTKGCPSMKHGCLDRQTSAAKSLKRALIGHPSYCVVTFTCRQAAVAARQCLADGKGLKSWEQVTTIPMNPLADAPPLKPFFCRGCCRPVTLTIPMQEKRGRKIIVWTIYVLFCFLYTIPLTFVSQVTHPTWLAEAFPDSEVLQDPDNFFFRTLAGFSSGYIYTLFFSILPQIFKLMAMSEGTSSSKVDAEEKALRFYWYFMLVTAFTGGYLVNLLIATIVEGNVTDEVRDILGNVAATMASEQAPVWLNWILVRTFSTLPLSYLLQIFTFFYGCIRIHWLNRVMRGGGPGGPPPYRIYIDSGVVFMCLTSLAPIVPIVAPAACLYYAMFIPILRWLHIFVYRPFYDGGGNRLPIIHEIIISSLILGQMLLGTVLLLKQSFILGTLTVFMPIPTYMFSMWTKEKFQRSYEDAALWQTSNLDGLAKHGSTEDREKYRRWLVDCHKASYVPICLSGGEDFLTIQPAVVVPIDGRSPKRFSTPRMSSMSDAKVAQKGAL